MSVTYAKKRGGKWRNRIMGLLALLCLPLLIVGFFFVAICDEYRRVAYPEVNYDD